jgi:hypothetical protein
MSERSLPLSKLLEKRSSRERSLSVSSKTSNSTACPASSVDSLSPRQSRPPRQSRLQDCKRATAAKLSIDQLLDPTAQVDRNQPGLGRRPNRQSNLPCLLQSPSSSPSLKEHRRFDRCPTEPVFLGSRPSDSLVSLVGDAAEIRRMLGGTLCERHIGSRHRKRHSGADVISRRNSLPCLGVALTADLIIARRRSAPCALSKESSRTTAF